MRVSALFLFLLVALNAEGAKILGIFHFHSKSHHILGSALLKALATKGHQVTMISPYPFKTPVKNYEDIELIGLLEYEAKNKPPMTMQQNTSFFQAMVNGTFYIQGINDYVLNHPAIQNLLKSDRSFDLVIQNWFFNDCYLGIANHFKAPVIAFSTFGAMTTTNKITQNPNPYSYVPFLMASFPSDMNFFQRLGNTLINLGFEFVEHFYTEPIHQRLLQKYFPEAPPLQDLINNISLVLLNSHFSIENPRPYVPSMVQVGGLHVEDIKGLDKDLKSYLDSATEGVVFFSLGSNVKISDMPADKIQAIVNSFGKLPVKVLWKSETENVPKLPSNVKLGKWFPQREILAHPNTKVFVTHGGMLSTTEAIYHGVPFVGMPFYADQLYNVADGVSNGYAVKVAYNDLTEEILTSAIKQVLNNPSYRSNIKIRSSVLRDQPLKPMDKAIYWVEYVLRHKGAHHLKTSAIKLTWYQYYLVDVFTFIIAVVFTCIFVISKIIKIVVRTIFGVKRKSKTD